MPSKILYFVSLFILCSSPHAFPSGEENNSSSEECRETLSPLPKSTGTKQIAEEELLSLLTQPIEILNLSLRTRNALRSRDIEYIGDIASKTKRNLLNRTAYFGEKAMNEVEISLSEIGLSFGSITDWPSSREQVKALIEKVNPPTTPLPVLALNAREEKILRLRFGIGAEKPHTLEEIGLIFGLSKERIRHIQNNALQKLYEFGLISRIIDLPKKPSDLSPEKIEELIKKQNSKTES